MDAHHAAIDLSSLIWPLFNFLIFVSIGVYIYRKHIRAALAGRSVTIEQHLRKAAQELAQVSQEHRFLVERLAAINDERDDILREFAIEGDKLAQATLLNAKKQAEILMRDAKARIASEFRLAEKDIQHELVLRAAKIARDKLRSGLSPDEDRRLREETLRAVG